MSEEIRKFSEQDKTFEPNSIFIPVDWGKQKPLEEILNESYNYFMELLTEDISHEIVEPKLLPESKK